MPVENEFIPWMVVGAGLGAVIRSEVAPAWTGIPGLVAVGVMTILGGLLGGVTLAFGRSRGTALVMGLAGGVASSGLYAVWGITSGLRAGVVFMVTVPVLTAVALTVGVSVVGIVRHRDRTGAPK